MMEMVKNIPAFVWLVLAVVLVVFFFIIIKVASNRSKEVEELEQAFREPYTPPVDQGGDLERSDKEEGPSQEKEEVEETEKTEDEEPAETGDKK